MKLPVLKAVATTFEFTREHWLRLLQIVWAPLLAMFAASSWFQFHIATRIDELQSRAISYDEELAFRSEVFWLNAGLSILMGLLGVVIAAGLLRLVIRGERPSLPFNLRWGTDEWVMLGTGVASLLVSYLIITLGFFLTGLTVQALGLANLGLWLFVPFLAAFIWLSVRLTLALPAAIGREQIGIAPAWTASSGQFWRLLAYVLIWVLIGLLFQTAVFAIVMIDQFGLVWEGLSGRMGLFEINMRLQQLATPETLLGVLRATVFTLVSATSAIVWTVSLGIAWKLIYEPPLRSSTEGDGSASALMGF